MTVAAIPAARQFRAIAYLRWCLFRNGFRRKGGKGEVVARIIVYPIALLLLIFPVVGSFAGTYFTAQHDDLSALPVIFTLIFALQVVVSINLSPPGLSFDPQSFIRFPLSFPRFLIVRLFLGLLSPSTIVGTLCFLSVATAVSILQPRLIIAAFAAAILLAITNMIFIRMVFAWVDRWLSTRRSRELFTVLIFAASLGFQYLNVTYNNVGNRSSRHQQAARYAAMQHLYTRAHPLVVALPPGLAGAAVINASARAPLIALLDLTGVALTGAICLAIFAWRMQREYRGENLSEATPRITPNSSPQVRHARADLLAANDTTATGATRAALLPPIILASLRKEFLYVRRNTSQFYGLVAPLAMVFILAGRLGSFSRTGFTLPIAALYSFLGASTLAYNVFGLDGAGVQLYFFAPVSVRGILIGKNLFGFLINLVQIVLLFVVLSFTAGLPGPWTIAATLSWLLLAIFVNVTVGNIRSLTAPKRVDPGKLTRKQASQLSALLSIGIVLALGALGAGLLILARLYGIPWLPVPVLLTLGCIAFSLYLYGLSRVESVALNHRETLIEELTKVSA